MITINKIINDFEVIAASHSEIKSFGYGYDFDINNQLQSNMVYPQIWVQPLNSQSILGRNNNNIQRNFRVWCYDLERQDDLNKVSVWNDTELILLDVIRLFGYNDTNYKLVNNPLLIPFSESFGEDYTGYFCEIVIQTADLAGGCYIPGY